MNPTNEVQKLVDALREHNTVYFYITDDTTHTHSRLSPLHDVQAALNAFYTQYDIPHDAVLAQEGKTLLKQALVQ